MGNIVLILLSTSLVLLITLAWKAFYWVWLRPIRLQRYLRGQGIHGAPYKFLHGNLKENVDATKKARTESMGLSHRILPRVIPFISQTIQKYGKFSVIWYGPNARVFVMDLDLIRDMLSNKYGHFSKTRITPISKFLVAGLVSHEGEKWMQHRRIINPAFHMEKLKMMLPAFYTSCSEMVNKWEKLVPDDSGEFDVWPELQNLTADVISRAAFGSSFEEGRRIFQLQTEQAGLVIQVAQSAQYPGSSLLPTKLNMRMKEINREVRTLISDIIHTRENATKAGDANTDDLLGLLMQSNFKEIQETKNTKNGGMTIDEVIEECKLFYFAGQETTSTTLVWAMILLSMHPEWQVQARDEIFEVFGKRKPDFDGLNHLKIVPMIIYEVLRLYPPVIFLQRCTNKTTKLGEVCLPQGLHISIPTIMIHRDCEIWGDDAEMFNPGRFSDGILKASKNQLAFFPFGWGPRICVGQNFAILEAKMALAMILQHFTFHLAPSYVHAPFTIVTLQPQYGAQLILNKL